MASTEQRGASRRPWRTLGIGAAAIGVLAVAAMVAISARGCGEGPPAVVASDGSGGDPARPLDGLPSGRFAPAGPLAAPAPAARLPEDVDPSWRDTRVVFRLREMGADASYVVRGLQDARAQMGRCFEAEGRPGTAPTGGEGTGAPADLVLYLESREGAIDVVEVRVESLGNASRSLVECCRDVLRGHEIKSPSAVPGRRFRVHYPLQ